MGSVIDVCSKLIVTRSARHASKRALAGVCAIHGTPMHLLSAVSTPPCRLLFRPTKCRFLLSCPLLFICLDRSSVGEPGVLGAQMWSPKLRSGAGLYARRRRTTGQAERTKLSGWLTSNVRPHGVVISFKGCAKPTTTAVEIGQK